MTVFQILELRYGIHLHFPSLVGLADDRIHDGKSVTKQEICENLDKMPDFIKLIAFLKQFQVKQDKCSDEIDRKRHHLKHALSIIPPCSE